MGLWDRYGVPALISCACATKPIRKQREKVVPLAKGRVLELGCGSGTNFDMYDWSAVDRLDAIEPAIGMLKRAEKTSFELGLTDKVNLTGHGAEDLPFPDQSFDTVVITFVLCTIPDWEGALREVRRVLKPDGTVLFSEHGLSPDEDIAKWQRRIEPIYKPIAGGCHMTRDIPKLLSGSGFDLNNVETMYLPSTPKILGYVSWGTARLAT